MYEKLPDASQDNTYDPTPLTQTTKGLVALAVGRVSAIDIIFFLKVSFILKDKYLLLNKIEQLEIIKLYNKFLDKIIWLLENNYSLSIYMLDEGILNVVNQETTSKLLKIKTLLENSRRI